MPWELGREFQIVTVSIDPDELPQRAALTKQKYLKLYARPGAAAGWHFLTGGEKNIEAAGRAVGFGYTYLAKQRQFAHPAVLILCTPDGRVWRYLGGVQLRAAHPAAGAGGNRREGKAGTVFDQVLLYCFHYDETSGRYGPAAFHLLQIAGGLTAIDPRRRVGGRLAAGSRATKKPDLGGGGR